MKHSILIFLFVFIGKVCFVQNEIVSIDIQVNFGNQKINLNQWYESEKDTFSFETVKFFISNLQFVNEDSLVYSCSNSYYLIDLEDSNSLQVSASIPSNLNYSSIKFNLGIDSVTNTSGAMGGVLDPTNGMYWTWQSGYINFKLEGVSKKCTARKNYFQFHLGGYSFPNNALQSVELNISPKANNIVYLDIESIMNRMDLTVKSSIMSPDGNAVELSKKIANSFKL